MYYSDRVEAGQLLAKRLQKYKDTTTTVLALSSGGVLVGEYIAKQLNAGLTLLFSSKIMIPGESQALGAINQTGEFSYNTTVSPQLVSEYEGEYHNFIEAEKLSKIYELNKMTGKHKMMDRHRLRDHTVILVSDGVMDGSMLEAAYQYLKPIRIARLVAAFPIATVPVVDRLHILVDEIHCLSVVTDKTFEIEHYYTNNEMPTDDDLLDRIDHLATE